MTAPLASAVVDLGVDADQFDRDLRREVAVSGVKAGRELDKAIKAGVDDTGDDIGRDISRDIASGIRRNRGQLTREGRQAGGDAGDATGRSFSDSFRLALGFQAATAALRAGLAPLQGVVQGLGLSLFAGQAAAAAASLLQLAAALAPAVGIVAVLPGFLAVGAAALFTFKIALSGVGEAFSAAAAGDAEQFEKAIAELAPAAREVAREFFALQPALDTFRNTIQQAFFEQFVGALKETADLLLGPVSTGMASVAAQGGRVVTIFGEVAREGATLDFLNALFATTASSLETLTLLVAPLLQGFRGLAGVALPFVQQFAVAITALVGDFAQFLNIAVASGQATAWIENAVNVLQQLFFVVQQVGGIFAAVFQAAGAAAGDALGAIGSLLLAVNQFLASAEGQQALTAIFATLGVIGGELGNVFVALAEGLGTLAPVIGSIAQILGPALSLAISAIAAGLSTLAPALIPVAKGISDAFTAIAPALAPLGTALGGVLRALAPLLPVVGELIKLVGTNLTSALTYLVTAAEPVIKAFADALLPIFPDLIAAAKEMAPPFIRLAGLIGTTFGDAITDLLPPIVALLPELINGLIPAMTDLAKAFAGMVPVLAPVVKQLVETMLPLLPDLIPLIVSLAEAFVAIFAVILRIQGPLLKLVIMFVAFAADKALTKQMKFIAEVLTLIAKAVTWAAENWLKLFDAIGKIDWSAIGETIKNFIDGVIQFFVELPQKIMDGVAALPQLLEDFFRGFLDRVRETSITILAAIITLFMELPQKIYDAVVGLPELLLGIFVKVWEFVSTNVTEGMNAVLQFFVDLPGRIFEAINELPGQIGQFFTDLWNNAYNIVRDGINSIVNLVGGLPGRIGDFYHKFVNAGRDLINGMINGLQDISGGSLSSLGNRIIGVVKNGINSGIRAINNYINDVNSKIPGGNPIPRIPTLARGGLFNESTLAIIGEAGPELALPLSGARRQDRLNLVKKSGLMTILANDMGSKQPAFAGSASGAQVTNNINIHTPATDPGRIADKVLDAIARGVR